ncbi:hypothetical protein FH972_025230 [Carpinus fangiana]|uniref:protein-histidine N-methyltransferase n=1 Tax=Carpinus fangiana TaxID=176857 RepID=A0A5N6L104_9ROSI|nr:hypothetical protein FH972_025230 [Carpinus fangiana]
MSGFSFNFSGDDIEDDGSTSNNPIISTSTQDERMQDTPDVPVRRHNLQELLSDLPSRIAYSTTLLIAPQGIRQTLIPRRALFDVKMQLMAEADDSSLTAAAGLGASDIETHVYEGGFKAWEGAVDLARLVLARGPRRDLDEASRLDAVVELGCGQALPSLVLFQHMLRAELTGKGFVLADYNDSVLRLVTLPNIVLVWALERAQELFEVAPSVDEDGRLVHGDGDLEITDELKSRFAEELEQRGLELLFLSGPWGSDLVKQLPLQQDMAVLVLAAETIYSPASLASFTDTLIDVLQRVKMGKGIVASKRVYFGVGGGVDEFKERAGKCGAVAAEVENSGIEGCDRSLGSGVGRCLLEAIDVIQPVPVQATLGEMAQYKATLARRLPCHQPLEFHVHSLSKHRKYSKNRRILQPWRNLRLSYPLAIQALQILSADSSNHVDGEEAHFAAGATYDKLMAPFFPPPNLLLSDGCPHARMRERWDPVMGNLGAAHSEFRQVARQWFSELPLATEIQLYRTMKYMSWRLILVPTLGVSPGGDEAREIERLQEDVLRGQFSVLPRTPCHAPASVATRRLCREEPRRSRQPPNHGDQQPGSQEPGLSPHRPIPQLLPLRKDHWQTTPQRQQP